MPNTPRTPIPDLNVKIASQLKELLAAMQGAAMIRENLDALATRVEDLATKQETIEAKLDQILAKQP